MNSFVWRCDVLYCWSMFTVLELTWQLTGPDCALFSWTPSLTLHHRHHHSNTSHYVMRLSWSSNSGFSSKDKTLPSSAIDFRMVLNCPSLSIQNQIASSFKYAEEGEMVHSFQYQAVRVWPCFISSYHVWRYHKIPSRSLDITRRYQVTCFPINSEVSGGWT